MGPGSPFVGQPRLALLVELGSRRARAFDGFA
jgi:hypothetical protein